MNFGREETEEATLGLTPLIDVVLLLLIFFVVTTTFQEQRIRLQLPEAVSSESGEVSKLVVTLTKDGKLSLDQKPVSLEELDTHFKNAAHPDAEMEVRADKEVPHGRVVSVLDRARRHGIYNVGIAVEGSQEN